MPVLSHAIQVRTAFLFRDIKHIITSHIFLYRYIFLGILPIGILNRTTADYQGPLPTSILEQTDPWLILAWVVLLLSVVYWFTRSNLFWTLMENIRNTWREAEAQHQHID